MLLRDIMDWNIRIPELIKAYSNQYNIPWGVLPRIFPECRGGQDQSRPDPTFYLRKSERFLCRGSKCCQKLIFDNEGVRTRCAGPFCSGLRSPLTTKTFLHQGWRCGEMLDLLLCLSLRLKIDCLVDKLVCLLTSKKFFL